MSNNKSSSTVLALLALLFFLQACYEPQSGCLDAEAVNYDFSADESDPEDCIYPELRLRFEHVYSYPDTTVPLRLDTFYLDEAGTPFRINRFDFLISDIRLSLEGGGSLDVDDEIDIYIEDPNQPGLLLERVILDNFGFVTAGSNRTIDVGTVTSSAQVASVSFFVGVAGQANVAVPDSFPLTHPLGLTDSLIYFSRDSGYVFQLIELFRDTAATDTVPERLRIGTFENLKAIELPVEQEKIPGFHYRITVQADYRKWLQGINVKQNSAEELAEQIVGNTTEAFSVIAVDLLDN